MEGKQLSQVVVLPSLSQPKVNYRRMPRRYEETKPAIVQDFTHRRIVDLGHEIHRRTVEDCNVEKAQAILEAENDVWQQAEVLKRETVEKAITKVHAEHEKVIKRLIKAHEKALKEEAVRVEGQMQKLALEQVQEERAAGDKRLQMAVKDTENRGYEQMTAAVATARMEEQDTAAKQRAQLVSVAEDKLQRAMQAAAAEKHQALQELTKRKAEERDITVKTARADEQASAALRLDKQRDFYEQQLRILQSHVGDRKRDIGRLEAVVQQMEERNNIICAELLETRGEFDKFISRVRPFNQTDSGFLLPPAKTLTQT